MRQLERLSKSAPVNMTDYWHDIATLEHFWIRRRFDVLCNLLRRIDGMPRPLADVGCGRGLLQRQIETHFAFSADGFDLDEHSLSENISQNSRVCLYNIFECNADLYQAYGSIFLFDILEHVEDQLSFVKSVLFHLRPGGLVLINLPAFMHLYSSYDTMAGHIRRYTYDDVVSLGTNCGLDLVSASYWGAPYYLLLLARKLMLVSSQSEKEIVERGFEVKSKVVNNLLRYFGKMEFLPQRVFGTSVMAVFRKPA